MKIERESLKPIEFDGLEIRDYTAERIVSSSLAEITVPAGARHKRAWSKKSDKYYYVINGKLTFIVDNQVVELSSGDVCIIPRGTRFSYENKTGAVAHPGLCAPFSAAVLEELIAFGCRKFIACGSAGVLDRTLAKGTVVVPSAAVRDEGTSYHYVSPSREIATEPEVVAVIESVLRAHGVKYQVGKTWTTDAIYRETKNRIAKRKSEGCLTVEMECSAFLAVAKFRGVRFGQLLATGDDVSGDEWVPRHTEEHKSFPERMFWLSVEACMRL